ncbi:unnamed protein product [Vicia faba]|uniref:Uncharacterized protein n=1 Tax=Vicia faba TaxID=3906 RepID=A0AAV1B2F8_VICFA|nr:unnamed protein product [Vicia faba]
MKFCPISTTCKLSYNRSRPPLLPPITGMTAAITNCPRPSPSAPQPNKLSSISSTTYTSFLQGKLFGPFNFFMYKQPHPNHPFSMVPLITNSFNSHFTLLLSSSGFFCMYIHSIILLVLCLSTFHTSIFLNLNFHHPQENNTQLKI